MYSEGEEQPRFKPNWKKVFVRDFCNICENRSWCPYNWECHDMKEFIENNEGFYANLDDDNTKDGSE